MEQERLRELESPLLITKMIYNVDNTSKLSLHFSSLEQASWDNK